ncbi:MAG TPA: argininosuccinate lyase [Nitrososphaerales archaeon]|nr:argininosuccinate lyase [Nitrososphaerales archaeon]
MDNILRGSRVKASSKRANDFTSSVGFDGPLSRHVVEINMAHMLSLMKSGEVGEKAGTACLAFLERLPGHMKVDPSTEDVHHWLEQNAVATIGMESAGYLNLGKSRNDQVAAALRMEVRSRVLQLLGEADGLMASLLKVMRRFGDLPLPGYTHLQRAQPTTVSHHMQSHFEAVLEDADRLAQLYRRVNRSPMGSAAFAGTSVKVDRAAVAKLLGFDGLVSNSMFAVSSRSFVLEALADLEILMVDLSRMAEELILWSSTEFGFVELGDEYSATSSIMPQKKNPVVAEMVRAKCGSVIGDATAAFAIAKALPNSYNLDLQEITPHLWRAFEDASASSAMTAGMLATVKFDSKRLAHAFDGDMSTATELANELVRSEAVPFRQAHQIVGELVRYAVEKKVSLQEAAEAQLPTVSEKIAGRPIKIDKERLRAVLDALKTLRLIGSAGGANPAFAARQMVQDKRDIEKLSNWLADKENKLDGSANMLRNQVRTYLRREVRS